MELVLAHTNTDFDSLASQLAVAKLVPGVRMIPGYPLGSDVRGFLALYRDSLPLAELAYIDAAKVEHVYIVDCQHVERLDELGKKLIQQNKVSYTIFDHHQFDPEGLGPNACEDSVIETAGSCTSLIVEKLRERAVKLQPFEATLLLLGVYDDSGCLTYSGTRAVDARAVEYLLQNGADLARVNNFLNTKLSDDQTKLFQELIQNLTSFTVCGARIVVAHAECPKYVEGLATLTRRLLDVNSADAAATVVRMRDRSFIVGRSDTPAVNVRDLARTFGGDGHPGAASAVSRDDQSNIISAVTSWLEQNVRPEVRAYQIMSSPVRTVLPETTMEEAGKIMLRYALDGLVVGTAEEIVGIISRRDVDKAKHHRLDHAPVSGFMSRPVVTVQEDAPLSEMQGLMMKHDIGRLPVNNAAGALVGMVNRRDILHFLFGSEETIGQTRVVAHEHRIHLHKRMEEMDAASRWVFHQLGEIAAANGMKAYAVGGCVRDLFLSRRNFDLDFVIEGNAIELAQALERTHPDRFEIVATHDRFKTATLRFSAEAERHIDLSTARIEFYEFPAALPTVEPSVLEQDLYRRDFTINALAICLNPDEYGDVIDFFEGVGDIDHKLIRILHQFSFIEDPTRIVRAVRFAVRLGFHLEARTREHAERAIRMGIFDELGGFRLREELHLILDSEHRVDGLALLDELGSGLDYLLSGAVLNDWVRQCFSAVDALLKDHPVHHDWVIYLGVLLALATSEQLEAGMERLTLANDEREWIRAGLALRQRFTTIDCAALSPSQIYTELAGLNDQSLLIAAAALFERGDAQQCVLKFMNELRNIKPAISGHDLIRLGFAPGPKIGEVLEQIHKRLLDKEITDVQQEIAVARSFLDALEADRN